MKMKVWVLGLCCSMFFGGCQSVQHLENEKGRCYRQAFTRECTARGRSDAGAGVVAGQQKARSDRNNPDGPGYYGCDEQLLQRADFAQARKQDREWYEWNLVVTAYYCPSDGSVSCEAEACQEGDTQGGPAGYSAAGGMYDYAWNLGYCHPDARIDELNTLIDEQVNFVCRNPPPGP